MSSIVHSVPYLCKNQHCSCSHTKYQPTCIVYQYVDSRLDLGRYGFEQVVNVLPIQKITLKEEDILARSECKYILQFNVRQKRIVWVLLVFQQNACTRWGCNLMKNSTKNEPPRILMPGIYIRQTLAHIFLIFSMFCLTLSDRLRSVPTTPNPASASDTAMADPIHPPNPVTKAVLLFWDMVT